MDCRTARLLLDFSRPLTVELEEHDVDALQDHLADCPACGSLAQAERTADHAIGQAVRDVSIPLGLRERLLAGVDVQLRADSRRRRWRMAVSAAAAVFILLGSYLFFSWQSRPVAVDVERLAGQMPFPGIRSISRQQAQDFFHSRGFPVTAPTEFDYQTLQYCDVTSVQGREVPILVFGKGEYQARVYILSDDRFNLADAFPGAAGAASGYKVELRRNPTDGHLVYLILYTGDSLQPFLSSHPTQGET
ncbi:MAG TPA: hypothetical protein VFA18_11820 [Gemmataceae bacterium]|nr:hypothetical protein [Gemmataceae bacterium]